MSLENTPAARISALAAAQKTYFRSGATLSEAFRRTMLRRLDAALANWEKRLCDALWTDLHKSPEEAYLTEISIVRGEIRSHLRHLGRWMRPAPRPTPLKLLPAKSRIVSQPLGQALIVAPWNYPVQLLLNPLVGAISAGCTALLETLSLHPERRRGARGDDRRDLRRGVRRRRAGRPRGQHPAVRHALGRDLLHGKPRAGTDRDDRRGPQPHARRAGTGRQKPRRSWTEAPDIEVAARRIAWGKALNAGQTCIAPDYLLIHRSLQDEFSRAFARALHRLHGDDAQQSLHYGRLVNDRAFERVTSYLAQGKILVGGRTDPSDRYIEPTLLAEVDPGAPVMQEECFGPVLPMLPFDDIGEAVALINDREKPLALYYFGPEKTGREVLLHTSSGGACINDTIMQIANDRLPFGGVGNSGMGRYHGHDSFDAFSLRRGVVESPARPDLPLRYPPYKGFRWVKKIL